MIIAQKRPASRAVRRSYTVIKNETFLFGNLNYIRSEIMLGSVVGPVIQANRRLIFEDDLRSGSLLYFTVQ